MSGNTIWIVVIVIIAIAFILFLVRRNVKDVEDTSPDLTKALEDTKPIEEKPEDNKQP